MHQRLFYVVLWAIWSCSSVLCTWLGMGYLVHVFFFWIFGVVISCSYYIWFALKEKRNERIKRSKKGWCRWRRRLWKPSLRGKGIWKRKLQIHLPPFAWNFLTPLYSFISCLFILSFPFPFEANRPNLIREITIQKSFEKKKCTKVYYIQSSILNTVTWPKISQSHIKPSPTPKSK